MTRRGVILFGHGSRDPAWRSTMDAVARRIAEKAPSTPVICAFLELQAPDFGGAVAQLASEGAEHVTVLPMFLGIGKHARQDLPALVQAARMAHPGMAFTVLPSVGELPEVIEVLAASTLGTP
jgi:sirohydrochlorin cobaltochelatase